VIHVTFSVTMLELQLIPSPEFRQVSLNFRKNNLLPKKKKDYESCFSHSKYLFMLDKPNYGPTALLKKNIT
jgi:hypothetical protein